ncbi:MAG TPA: DNA recombination protein RmuC [Patescibacteria group bacterium]|nr:DNA recombination protein RmuC [Patescibacteria group bacterium]
MSVVAVVVVVVVAIFAASVLGAWLRGGSPNGDAKEVREEMQVLLTAQAQGFSAQMGQVTQLVSQQFSEVRRELEMGVANTGRITVDAQKEMSEQLRSSTDVMSRLTEHLGKVQESGRELTEAAKAMQAVLGGPNSRGVLGETQLESLLGDVLPRASYQTDYRFPGGATVAAALRVGSKWVAIDADFPMDAYRKVAEKGVEARPEFAETVRGSVDEIAAKYILPDEGTLDFALMFVPSESAFYELLVTADDKGRLDDYCRQRHVLPVSPNSLHGYLSAILVGLKGTEAEENARRMLAQLHDVKRMFEEFGEVHDQLGQQLHEMQQQYQQAGRQLEHTLAAITEAMSGVPAETTREETQGEEPAALATIGTNNNGA